MKKIKTFEEHFERKEFVNNLHQHVSEKYTPEELDSLIGEGFFDFVKGLVLNPFKKRELRKLAEKLVEVRVKVGKLKIEGDQVEQFEDELESKYDAYDYNTRGTAPKSHKSDSTHDAQIDLLEAQEEDIITMMDSIGEENETLAKYVSKLKLEARFKSTEVLLKFADDDIKRTLQKMARQDNQKIKTIDKQLDSELS
jgi:hypothetical protein